MKTHLPYFFSALIIAYNSFILHIVYIWFVLAIFLASCILGSSTRGKVNADIYFGYKLGVKFSVLIPLAHE